MGLDLAQRRHPLKISVASSTEDLSGVILRSTGKEVFAHTAHVDQSSKTLRDSFFVYLTQLGVRQGIFVNCSLRTIQEEKSPLAHNLERVRISNSTFVCCTTL